MYNVYCTPTHNFFKALKDYVHALQYSERVQLRLVRNEDCSFPIKERIIGTAEDYVMLYGAPYSINEIKSRNDLSDFDKELTINWEPVFGTREAADNYYKTGVLSPDNFKGVGYCHYVKRTDAYNHFKDIDPERAKMFLVPDDADEEIWMYPPKRRDDTYYKVKIFKHKVWAVVIGADTKPNHPFLVSMFTGITYPLKYIPRRSILRMDEYTNYRFRVGGVRNGYSIEFQIPKKFSFDN